MDVKTLFPLTLKERPATGKIFAYQMEVDGIIEVHILRKRLPVDRRIAVVKFPTYGSREKAPWVEFTSVDLEDEAILKDVNFVSIRLQSRNIPLCSFNQD